VVDHQLGDDFETPVLGLPQKGLEIPQGPVLLVDIGIIGDVVAVIPQG
jgi:hypothetical protein